MNDIEIINLWKSNSKKINENLLLNKKNAEDIIKMKTQSLLSSMKPVKIFTVMMAVLWVGIGGTVVTNIFLSAYSSVNHFFLYSAAIQILLTAIALVIYLYQTITIYQTDITEPILATQEKIAKLISTSLWVTRFMFLQLPLWTIFYWNKNMLENGSLPLLIIQGIVTLSFTIAALWLFFNIKYENRNKKWFRIIFNGKEWAPLLNSMDLLSQVDEFKTEK
ncbi:MAG TPA: hypothetical protein PLD63_07065 [Ignavibacteria bacterium]|nr:hypothetical protein [Ignavibacteria bacterium]